MTTLREAAQQALEALESVQDHRPNDETNSAIRTLRAALAEPVQEPVAYIDEITRRLCKPNDDHRRKFPMCYQPFYTAPPQRKPLTEREIVDIGMTHQSLGQVVRAVEAKHGIKD
jgi:hypothetical protein